MSNIGYTKPFNQAANDVGARFTSPWIGLWSGTGL